MNWITLPNDGASPACGNCWIYAHGSCSSKCKTQSCSIRF